MATEASLDYILARQKHPANDVARFVENRVILAEHGDVVYSGRLDSIVDSEEAKRQDLIRWACHQLHYRGWVPSRGDSLTHSSAELWEQAGQEKEQLFQIIEQVRAKLAKNAPSQQDRFI